MKKSAFRFLIHLGLLGVLTLFPYASGAAAKLPVLDRMVASVNNEAITESDLNRQIELLQVRLKQSDVSLPPLADLRKQLLERLILEKLQLQLAAAQGLEIDEATLNTAVEEIATRDGISVHQMQEFLEEQGIHYAQFRESIRTEILLSKLQQKEVGQNINISKTEIAHFLRSPAGQDQSGAEYRVGHILIPLSEEPSLQEQQETEKAAKAIVANLKAGADFSKTAMAKSSDQLALEGGDLGWRTTATIPTLFAKIVTTLQVGAVYGPLKDMSGFHIIKLLDKRLSETTHNQKAMEILYQRKFDESLVTWLRHLRSDAEVKIYLNDH